MQDIVDNVDEYDECEWHSNPINQFQYIIEQCKKYGTTAISDDKFNWAENDHHNEVSKLLLIDEADYNTQHIFFDDQADE